VGVSDGRLWHRPHSFSSETQQQSDDGAKYKGSHDEPFPNVETDGTHYQEANCHNDASKLRVHAHHAHGAGVASAIMLLHSLIVPLVHGKSEAIRADCRNIPITLNNLD
jgi:hypothetical protein